MRKPQHTTTATPLQFLSSETDATVYSCTFLLYNNIPSLPYQHSPKLHNYSNPCLNNITKPGHKPMYLGLYSGYQKAYCVHMHGKGCHRCTLVNRHSIPCVLGIVKRRVIFGTLHNSLLHTVSCKPVCRLDTVCVRRVKRLRIAVSVAFTLQDRLLAEWERK